MLYLVHTHASGASIMAMAMASTRVYRRFARLASELNTYPRDVMEIQLTRTGKLQDETRARVYKCSISFVDHYKLFICQYNKSPINEQHRRLMPQSDLL